MFLKYSSSEEALQRRDDMVEGGLLVRLGFAIEVATVGTAKTVK
jgi:hypothetical protein